MSESVLVGILSLGGTLIGTLGGILASGKLTAFRLESLEKRVQAHNSLIERMYRAEARLDAAESDIREIRNR